MRKNLSWDSDGQEDGGASPAWWGEKGHVQEG